jgi:hypothetical protein
MYGATLKQNLANHRASNIVSKLSDQRHYAIRDFGAVVAEQSHNRRAVDDQTGQNALSDLVGKLGMSGSGKPNWHIRKGLWHVYPAALRSSSHLAQLQAIQSSGIRLRLVIWNVAIWISVYGLVPIGVGHLDREVFKRISVASSDLYYEHHSTRLD